MADILIKDIIDMTEDQIPPGIYTVEFLTANQSTTKTDTLMLDLLWRIVDGKHEGKTFMTGIALSKGATKDVVNYMIRSLDPSGQVIKLDELAGKKCRVEITGSGSKYVNCKKYLPL